MCYQVIEVYAVCGCIYFQHAIDQCASVNQSNHVVEKKFISVGTSCAQHAGAGASGHGPSLSGPYPSRPDFEGPHGRHYRHNSTGRTSSFGGDIYY